MARRSQSSRGVSTSDIEGRSLLLVDDEIVFARTLSDGLVSELPGVEIHLAHDGRSALEILAKTQVDLVVTDVNMPIMDGTELVAEMVSRDFNVPVIMMTAYGTRAVELDARRQGVLSVVDKPIDFPMMVEICAGALAARSRGAINGITLAGFLQLLEMEHRSCAVRVFGDGQRGLVMIREGKVYGCSTRSLEGFEALCELIGWESPRIEVAALPEDLEVGEPFSLHFALLESARLSDETRRQGHRATAATDASLVPPPPKTTSKARAVAPATNDDDRDEPHPARTTNMASIEQALNSGMEIQGAVAIALVDYESGMSLGERATNDFPIQLAAAGNTEVVRAKLSVMKDIGAEGRINDILITLDHQFHLIAPLSQGSLFLYLAIDRKHGNLGLARHRLKAIEKELEI